MNQNLENWNEWFAGVTDGDGCFYINKKNQTISFELTTHIVDSRVVYNIKNHLKAGSVTLRSSGQSIRYRVKKRSIISDIVNRLNGKLYNTVRIKQFKTVCEMLEIKWICSPALLSKQNGYISGLIDSDGTIVISVSNSSQPDSQKSNLEGKIIRLANSKGFNQISLKITSIDEQKLKIIQQSYAFGTIYKEKPSPKSKSLNPKYHWTIRSSEEFAMLYENLKKFPLKSTKMHRIRLVKFYFHYKKLKYHLKSEGTLESKIWSKFARLWFKYSF